MKEDNEFLCLVDKPFGMLWPMDKMIKFLEGRGYIILERKNSFLEKSYHVAVKENSDFIPEQSNIAEEFMSEIQDIILKVLQKY